MRKSLFTFALFASALTLPLTAHADPIDDFVLTGGGHTITYSLPATSSFPDYELFTNFSESAPATIDGVSGYTVQGQYFYFFSPPASLILGVPPAVFGTAVLALASSSPFISWSFESEPEPPPYFQEAVIPTFIPGTYDLEGLSSYGLQPLYPPVDYTLTITPETTPTPEPSTLALFATGVLGLIAFAAKRKGGHHLFN